MSDSVEVRPMRDDEREALAALYNSAYRVGIETGREWAAGADMGSSVACVFRDGRIASSVRIIPYEIYAGGKVVRMGGIGGVATWCDLQGRGYAGMCMAGSLQLMNEQGYAVSSLYPFSYRYYGKFGWSLCGRQVLYSGLVQSQFSSFEESRFVRVVLDAEKDSAALAGVYNEFAARYNGMARRSAAQMAERVRKNGATNSGQTYLIEIDGTAVGYFMCEHLKDGWYSHCQITQFACNNPAAWRALMGFCRMMPTNVSKISIYAPERPSLWEYVVEPTVQTRVNSLFMGRVVNLKKAVEGRGYASTTNGMVRVKVDDKYAPWNNGVWTLQFINGNASATRSSGDDMPFDCTLSIQEFSQLWFGYLDVAQLKRDGFYCDMSVQTAHLLSAVFCDNVSYLTEAF